MGACISNIGIIYSFKRDYDKVLDYYNPPYTLIGTKNATAKQVMKKIYSSGSLTSLQKNAQDIQKWPLLNLVRQILKSNNFFRVFLSIPKKAAISPFVLSEYIIRGFKWAIKKIKRK